MICFVAFSHASYAIILIFEMRPAYIAVDAAWSDQQFIKTYLHANKI
jgi:hypothetical protein